VHEEEMLAVLMTTAAEGQDRPGLAEAADLIIGALRVRCQALRGGVPGWRGALAVIGAAAVLGLLAGIPFATQNPPLYGASATVRLAAPDSPATAHAQQAIASSYPVMARAARKMQPAMSAQALQSDVHVTLVGDHEMVISVQATPGAYPTRAAAAVANTYVAYVSSRNSGKIHTAGPMRVSELVRFHGPTVQYVSSVAPRSGSADVLETSGFGAVCGALIGAAIVAVALIPGSRRPRMT
jgi:hypothetical protein